MKQLSLFGINDTANKQYDNNSFTMSYITCCVNAGFCGS